ncbi:hypothetical protein [Calidifontibacillus erzurumensis]|uniref:Uncharacterized protein n=1 Tax=Calidifontibacillus erzurumensis TaxID=2741433 RepID=A0A8J8KEK1_9BACI|nr:hypothetical protein [Calidifontibacillus erzurumensis]NSL51910.1 hypothetical protein [Calidifontibacillus erzurumensis]
MSHASFVKELYDELEARLQMLEQNAETGIVKRQTMKDYIMPTVISALITIFFFSVLL